MSQLRPSRSRFTIESPRAIQPFDTPLRQVPERTDIPPYSLGANRPEQAKLTRIRTVPMGATYGGLGQNLRVWRRLSTLILIKLDWDREVGSHPLFMSRCDSDLILKYYFLAKPP